MPRKSLCMKKFKISEHTRKKKQLLENAKDTLKQEFVGLDDIIDEIIHLITPWYLYPELQQKPTIVNLWGMTGVGKTSLVRRLSSLLTMEHSCHMVDMGNSQDSFEDLYNFFNRTLKQFPGEPFILCLDEFQYANSLKGTGEDVPKAYMRAIWEILDSGNYQRFNDSRWARNELPEVLEELRYFVARGVKARNGIVVENVKMFELLLSNSDSGEWADYDEYGRPVKKNKFQKFVRTGAIKTIYDCTERFSHLVELKDYLLTLNEQETVQFVENVLRESLRKETIDCTKSLIFVLGNLDEAFHFAGDMNPDISADDFYQRSKQININHVKRALKRSFRNEQIARLGNNHVIYPSFSKQSFQKIIQLELDKIVATTKETFNYFVRFDKSVTKLIYNEGVFPTQGTRPVFSTIRNLILPNISLLPAVAQENKVKANTVVVAASSEGLVVRFVDKNGETEFETCIKLKLKLTALRAPKRDSLQAITAVHESGHAIVSTLILGHLPRQIMSVTSETEKLGMMVAEDKERTIYNKKMILGKASVCLAGMVAEKLIFGEEHVTAGSSSDIATASRFVADFVKREGLAGSPYCVEVEAFQNENSVFDDDHYFNKKVKAYLDEAYQQAEKVLIKYRSLLKEVARVLANERVMKREVFTGILEKYAPEQNLELLVPKPFNYREALMRDGPLESAIAEGFPDFSLNKTDGSSAGF